LYLEVKKTEFLLNKYLTVSLFNRDYVEFLQYISQWRWHILPCIVYDHSIPNKWKKFKKKLYQKTSPLKNRIKKYYSKVQLIHV
jgi:hypothetical protein